jgi:hypothetical protein
MRDLHGISQEIFDLFVGFGVSKTEGSVGQILASRDASGGRSGVMVGEGYIAGYASEHVIQRDSRDLLDRTSP